MSCEWVEVLLRKGTSSATTQLAKTASRSLWSNIEPCTHACRSTMMLTSFVSRKMLLGLGLVPGIIEIVQRSDEDKN